MLSISKDYREYTELEISDRVPASSSRIGFNIFVHSYSL